VSDAGRDLVALSCAVSAGIHAALTPHHYVEAPAAGIAFGLSAVVLAGLAIALARHSEPLLLDGAIVVLAGLVGAYALAAVTGIPGVTAGPEPVDALGVTTKAVEILGILAALGAKASPARLGRPVPLTLLAVVASFSALAAVAVSSEHPHGEEHGPHAHAAAER
jgi:drug/metabolite transporter (DMT)-like permease